MKLCSEQKVFIFVVPNPYLVIFVPIAEKPCSFFLPEHLSLVFSHPPYFEVRVVFFIFSFLFSWYHTLCLIRIIFLDAEQSA